MEAHVKKRTRHINSFSLTEFRDILESTCVTCPICRMDIRDSKTNTEVNDLCNVIFHNYERCLTESINIDIRDDGDNDDDERRDDRMVMDDGTASLIMNNNPGYPIISRRCQSLCCGSGIVFLLVYVIIHSVITSPQVQYYGSYNISTLISNH